MKISLQLFKFSLLALLAWLSCTPLQAQVTAEEGKASYYADYFEGRKTASGEPYQKNVMSAAHKTLPFGTLVRVTHLKSGRTLDVRINDRGPFVRGRIIDLSRKAADSLGMVVEGVAAVRVEVIAGPGEPAPPAETPAEAAPSTEPAVAPQPVLAELLRDANLPVTEAPTTGFMIEVGQYHHLGNARAAYLSLGGMAMEQVCVIPAGQDAEGPVYALMVAWRPNRDELEAILNDPEFRFSEAQIREMDKPRGVEPEAAEVE